MGIGEVGWLIRCASMFHVYRANKRTSALHHASRGATSNWQCSILRSVRHALWWRELCSSTVKWSALQHVVQLCSTHGLLCFTCRLLWSVVKYCPVDAQWCEVETEWCAIYSECCEVHTECSAVHTKCCEVHAVLCVDSPTWWHSTGVQCAMSRLQCAVCSVQYVVYSVQCPVVQCAAGLSLAQKFSTLWRICHFC